MFDKPLNRLQFFLRHFYTDRQCSNESAYIVPTSTSNQWVRISNTTVENAPVPERGQAFIRAADLKGFAVRITAAGVRSYIVEKRINGRNVRTTLGRHGELTAVQARKKAQAYLGQVAMGIDPGPHPF